LPICLISLAHPNPLIPFCICICVCICVCVSLSNSCLNDHRLNLPSPRSNASSHLAQEPPKSHRSVGEELDYYRNFLDDLVTVMRDGNEAAVAHLVDLIRSGVSKVQIHHAIQQLKIDGYNAPAPRA
jgi:hypothetical protein